MSVQTLARVAVSIMAVLALSCACARDAIEPPGAIGTPSPAASSEPSYTYPPSPTRGTPRPGRKPPVEAAALTDIYSDQLAAIGLVLTPRGGLIDRSDGGYEKSAKGDHLALYLEPADDGFTMQDYVDGIVEATKIFVPDVFERWKGLATMDVCQEPMGEVGELHDPPPVSQIEVTREQAADVDWDSVSVRDVVRAAEGGRLRLVLSDEITDSPEFRRAVD